MVKMRAYGSFAQGDQEGEQLDVDVIDEMITNGYTEEEAADAVQEELTANAGFKGRGKGKSKGKGFPTPWHKGEAYGPPDHRPSLEDRKCRLQGIKKVSRCKTLSRERPLGWRPGVQW